MLRLHLRGAMSTNAITGILLVVGLVHFCLAIHVPTVTLSNNVSMPMVAAGSFQYNETEAEASIAAALSVGFTMVGKRNATKMSEQCTQTRHLTIRINQELAEPSRRCRGTRYS